MNWDPKYMLPATPAFTDSPGGQLKSVITLRLALPGFSLVIKEWCARIQWEISQKDPILPQNFEIFGNIIRKLSGRAVEEGGRYQMFVQNLSGIHCK